MNELNIGKTVALKRKEKGITQEDLAGFIGVSKASVSKWETGHSYPDIALLPRLASYFDISIDELVGYEPQMAKEDISRTYKRLSGDFNHRPFEEVLSECREIVKKYYSCYPLLFQMGNLIVYYCEIVDIPEKIQELVLEAKEIYSRVKIGSTNVELIKKAQYMEAYCCLQLGDSPSAVDLLEAINEPQMNTGAGLAMAFQLQGLMEEAKVTVQSGIYQHLFHLFYLIQIYIVYSLENTIHFEKTIKRAFSLAETFNLRDIFPSAMISLYFMTARAYLEQENLEKSISMIEQFTELVADDSRQLKPCGDEYFSLINDWISRAELGVEIIKNEKTYRQRMIESLLNYIHTSSLSEDSRLRNFKRKLSFVKEELDKKYTF